MSAVLLSGNCQAGQEGFKLKLLVEGNLNLSHSYRFDASSSNRFPESGGGSQVSGRAPEEQNKGILTGKSASSGTHLKCIYANAHNIGNKQEELGMCAHMILLSSQRHGGTAPITGGHRLFRKDRQERWEGGVALYISGQLECMELHLGRDEELSESLWVRIKGTAGTCDIIVGICYRSSNQEDGVDEALHR